MRINLKKSEGKDSRRNILKDLLEQISEDYDLENWQMTWMRTKGLKHFIAWLEEKGYEVSEYSWPEEKDPVSYGLDFKDDNPQFVAMRLRYMYDEGDNR